MLHGTSSRIFKVVWETNLPSVVPTCSNPIGQLSCWSERSVSCTNTLSRLSSDCKTVQTNPCERVHSALLLKNKFTQREDICRKQRYMQWNPTKLNTSCLPHNRKHTQLEYRDISRHRQPWRCLPSHSVNWHSKPSYWKKLPIVPVSRRPSFSPHKKIQSTLATAGQL